MTSVNPLAEPSPAEMVGDVDHLYCCDPDVALCGLDLSDVEEGLQFPEMCPLCALADEGSCLRCGR